MPLTNLRCSNKPMIDSSFPFRPHVTWPSPGAPLHFVWREAYTMVLLVLLFSADLGEHVHQIVVRSGCALVLPAIPRLRRFSCWRRGCSLRRARIGYQFVEQVRRFGRCWRRNFLCRSPSWLSDHLVQD